MRFIVRVFKILGALLVVATAFYVTLMVLDYYDWPSVQRTPVIEIPPQPPLDHVPSQCANLPQIEGEIFQSRPDNGHLIVGDGTPPSAVQASSALSVPQNAARLFDDADSTYWHVNFHEGLPVEWVVLALSSSPAPQVASVVMRPRGDAPTQFFSTACFLGSDDGRTWNGIAKLSANSSSGVRWLQWTFKAPPAFQYYKLVIPNEQHNFFSIGKMELRAS